MVGVVDYAQVIWGWPWLIDWWLISGAGELGGDLGGGGGGGIGIDQGLANNNYNNKMVKWPLCRRRNTFFCLDMVVMLLKSD